MPALPWSRSGCPLLKGGGGKKNFAVSLFFRTPPPLRGVRPELFYIDPLTNGSGSQVLSVTFQDWPPYGPLWGLTGDDRAEKLLFRDDPQQLPETLRLLWVDHLVTLVPKIVEPISAHMNLTTFVWGRAAIWNSPHHGDPEQVGVM